MDTSRGKLIDLSEEKLDAVSVDTFRSILAKKYLLPPRHDNYRTLLRFLKHTRFSKERHYNYERATRRWEEMIEWRRKNGVDTIIQDFVYKEHEDVQLCYPHGFHGVDKAGRPIYIRYYVNSEFSKLRKVTTIDRFLKSYIQECEKMIVEKFPACSEIANKPIDSIVQIHVQPAGPTKFEGFKTFMFSSYLVIRPAEILHDYYPQTVHQDFYINTGKGKKLFFRLLNWLLDPRQRPEGIYALGQDFQKLLEFIDKDQLPTFLGGSCTCPGKGGCLRFEKGPWVVPKTMQQAKDKNDEMDSNKGKEIPETVQIIPETVQDTDKRAEMLLNKRREKFKTMQNIRETVQLPSVGSALSPETTTCHKCTELENNINLLSSKMDRLQTTLDQLLLPKEQAKN